MKSTKILKDELILSAQTYYEYLDANKKGRENIEIKSYYYTKDDELVISLRKKPYNADMLIIEIDDKIYELEDGSYYDDITNTLNITLNDKAKSIFKKNPKPKVELFSDLKFLVSNIKDFFKEHGDSLAYPYYMPIRLASSDIPDILNPTQKKAMEMVFSHPLSYVWGAPGSGKTQAVLFYSLLAYIKAGQKICILAPTNLALEQILTSLLAKFRELHFDESVILRLGFPTQTFLGQYPSVCDPSIFDLKMRNLFTTTKTLKERIEESFVIGSTLDGYIKRHKMLKGIFSHYFVDECAFVPLSKTLALCVDGAPISLFGDHKQLTPICEMTAKELKTFKIVNLFALSSIYIDEAFDMEKKNKLDKLYDMQNIKGADLKSIKHTWLNTTHRYGQNLATLLSSFIYKQELKGKDEDMEIYVIDSGKWEVDDLNEEEKTINKRNQISKNEIEYIKKLFVALKGNNLEKSVAILTPFVAQKNEIRKVIAIDDIHTIHASQGQEWESVIFSPVTLHYYLTDSRNMSALFALNVAISRTKKSFFIVCDVSAWRKSPNQFITHIINIGKELII